ncbi:SDR family oxidoreductase [Peribacillus huizhouensis]|uniref:NAD(P)-dependent dehydrogenase (Short-subunit alcohol dehydrogenase family) n=1 Tax=Peribacillus huizhouensis TaxID=1501239 RepID=A0ABR6CR06_9BACI|nr:SDR family oxidoreductase [Peribacillus huizhouensis]MBA9027467.1 NAD(P)-dependent dehydrogenase (short-subunit alcohol dehydrogenase family) [Peribacillus huizhouensis]
MGKKIAIVTGSASGFGLLTSLELAKQGFQVMATMRNKGKKTELIERAEMAGIADRIEIYELDVTSEDSIQRFKINIEMHGRVDVLVNNAGYAGAGFVEDIPIDEYRQQFETNVLGVIAITQTVLPYMREQENGKIIIISSISGKMGFPGLSPYVSSKFAIEGFSECLRLELKPFGIDVSLIEPGSYKTNIWTNGKHITEKSLHKNSPYHEYLVKMENYLKQNETSYGDPKDVAKKVAKLAISKEMKLRTKIGRGVKIGILLKSILPWKVWERMVLTRLDKN